MSDARPVIVVIDDSATVRLFFERSIEPYDVRLEMFASAEAALPLLAREVPALLFLDIIMPVKDGLTFLKEFRRIPGQADTPVVVVSSKDYAQDKSAARELGAVEFVIKPMSTRTIQDLIEQHTGVRPRS